MKATSGSSTRCWALAPSGWTVGDSVVLRGWSWCKDLSWLGLVHAVWKTQGGECVSIIGRIRALGDERVQDCPPIYSQMLVSWTPCISALVSIEPNINNGRSALVSGSRWDEVDISTRIPNSAVRQNSQLHISKQSFADMKPSRSRRLTHG